MKKIFSALMLCAVFAAFSPAGDLPADPSKLPEPAQTFIAANCPNAKIAALSIDCEGARIEDYKALLDDSTTIKFLPTGEIKEIKNSNGVPAAVVPEKIKTYLAQKFAGKKIIEFKKKRSGFEAKLSNGAEMKFSPDGAFIGFDD